MADAAVGQFLLVDACYVHVNPCFAAMLGAVSEGDLPSRPHLDDVDQRDRTRVLELHQACLRGETAEIRYECRLLRADGESLCCEVFARLSRYAGRAAIACCAIDRGERRRADERLRTLMRAIEQTRATVVVTDPAGRIEYVNPQFEVMTGYTVEEAIGQTPALLKSGRTPLAVYESLWGNIQSGVEWSGEILNRKKSGELFWEHMVASAVRDESGQISHLVAVKDDITARKRAEQELARANRTLRVLLESNKTLVHAHDEQDLLAATCRNLVEIGGYRLAFIGRHGDAAAERIEVAAQYGVDAGFLALVGDHARGQGVSGTAVRSGVPLVLRDLARHAEFADLADAALERGFAATIALPLRSVGGIVGVLQIFAGDPEGFAEDEVQLLLELADDLAYGLVSLRTRDEHARAERALRESEQRFRNISASALDAIVMVDVAGSITYWNPAAERMTGFAQSDVLGAAVLEQLVAPRDLARVNAVLAELSGLGGGRAIGRTIGFLALRRDGTSFEVEASTSAIELEGRRQLVVLARDVSERKAAEEALHIRNRAIESSSNAIIISRAAREQDNPIIYVNPAFARITGYQPEEALGRNPRFLLGRDWAQPAVEALRDALRHGSSIDVQLRNYRRDGQVFWAAITVSPVRDDAGRLTHFISVINDVTERVRFEEELQHRATHDALTGLANRTLLFDRIEQAVAHAVRSDRHVAVMLLDLDRFKVINDSLGHFVGDAVVQAVAARLSACVRRGDTVARIGGDEFVVVLAELVCPEDVASVAQKIQEALAVPIDLPGQPIFVSTSIGITLAPGDGSAAETLLRNADAAMYVAKDHGGACFRFYLDGMSDRARDRLSLEGDLRRAVERSEFLLQYQPKLDIRSGAVLGSEALIRWRHPTRGMVSPLDFIPLAEDTGLIVPIGEWALRTACAQAVQWQRAGCPPVTVAVNISARQFRHGGLAATVATALAESGLDPACLELELTESMIMHNAQATIGTLNELKSTGIKISIDDFGTGYSSLSYLRSFPVDTLKIDRSFVKDLTDSAQCRTIATTIVMLAHGLGMQVVAEGVETVDQLAFLQRNACDQIQGFLFSRPLAEDAFLEILGRTPSAGLPLLAALSAAAGSPG